MTTSLKAACDACGRLVRVRRDGRLYEHRLDGRPMRVTQSRDELCPGIHPAPGASA